MTPHIILAMVMVFGITMLISSKSFGVELYRGKDAEVTLDSTLSFGLQWRVQKRDSNIIGIANGGEAYSVNYDDGSQLLKGDWSAARPN